MHTTDSLPRRQFLKCGLVAAALPWVNRSSAANVPKGAEGLTTYQLGPRIWVRWNNRPLTCYRAHQSQKYPYMFPLAGPATGLPLTTETSLPYPHHRSLFFGCDRVNGANFWQEGFSRGQILSAGPKLGKVTKASVEILDNCTWQQPNKPPVMKDQRRVTVTAAGEELHFVDWEIVWTAVTDVQIQKTNHSLFSLRASADLTPNGGGTLINAEGASGEKATFGKPSPWCDFSGQRVHIDGKITEGIAIFDHPKNPWTPCPWFTRDYGFLSPTPMNFIEETWEWPKGKSVTMRYRVVLHVGDAEVAKLDQLYRHWST